MGAKYNFAKMTKAKSRHINANFVRTLMLMIYPTKPFVIGDFGPDVVIQMGAGKHLNQ